MDFEQQKQVVREQRAGYALFHRFEVEEWRKANFTDRLRDYADIMEFSKHLPLPDTPRDTSVMERWAKIRKRYDDLHR